MTGSGGLIVWIRREMRIRDHLALWSAVRDASTVIPLYVVDGGFHASSPARRAVIAGSLRHLRRGLKELGGNLFVRRGEPREVLLRLAGETGAAGVYLTRSYEPAVASADERLRAELESEGRTFRSFKDDVIFERDEVVNTSGEPFRVYSAYRRAWLAKRDEIPPPLPPIRAMRSPAIEPGGLPELPPESAQPGMAPLQAGESRALAALDDFLQHRSAAYRSARDMIGTGGTSRLSHHLAAGTLGARTIYGAVAERLRLGAAGGPAGAGVGRTEGLDTFLNQIIWREFYKQILANFPQVAGRSFRGEFDAVPWKTDPGLFDTWREGVTGYPLVDAAMRQLRVEGWMHNRGRMIAAGFLAKDLHLDWRMGERHFMEWLGDGDLALNNGGWQWAAGTGTDAQPWYRIFNPVLQGRKFDPDGTYVKKYVPELSAVPARYIHAPWEMPVPAAREAGVRIGRDYPAPVVDHATEREIAIGRYRPGRRSSSTGSALFNHGKYSNIQEHRA